jgi:hypothetical protein
MMHNCRLWTTILLKLIDFAIDDESKQASRLTSKKPIVAPTKKRGQTSQGTSSDESPEGVSDLKEAEDPAGKQRHLIAD